MAVDDELVREVAQRLAPLGDVTSRKMFGGAGFWESGDMFALLSSDSMLHFKVDDATRPRYEAAGSAAFAPQMGDRPPVEMPYFVVPDEIVADDDAFASWAADAVAVAHATARPKRGRS